MTNSKTTPTDKAGEPVACPFCGGKASVRTVLRAMVCCDECGSEGQSYSMVNDGEAVATERAIAAWNTRTHPQPSLSVGLDREAVARVIDPVAGEVDSDGCVCDPDRTAAALAKADAILALAAPAEGYVLVPVEPSNEMQVRGAEVFDQRPSEVSAIYRAMIAAAAEGAGQ